MTIEIGKLPAEMLHQIFSYTSKEEKVSFAAVNKLWKEFIFELFSLDNSSVLRRMITLINSGGSLDELEYGESEDVESEDVESKEKKQILEHFEQVVQAFPEIDFSELYRSLLLNDNKSFLNVLRKHIPVTAEGTLLHFFAERFKYPFNSKFLKAFLREPGDIDILATNQNGENFLHVIASKIERNPQEQDVENLVIILRRVQRKYGKDTMFQLLSQEDKNGRTALERIQLFRDIGFDVDGNVVDVFSPASKEYLESIQKVTSWMERETAALGFGTLIDV